MNVTLCPYKMQECLREGACLIDRPQLGDDAEAILEQAETCDLAGELLPIYFYNKLSWRQKRVLAKETVKIARKKLAQLGFQERSN